MRNKLAKKLRKDVMLKLYLGDGVTEKDLKKGKHDVFRTGDFKSTYRARKKNEIKKRKQQVVNHMLVNTEKPGQRRFPIIREVKERWR
jgi:hypothetical protein